MRYHPLRYRVLDKLRHEGEWIEAFDLATLLEASDLERGAIGHHLARLVERGEIEVRHERGRVGPVYRARRRRAA